MATTAYQAKRSRDQEKRASKHAKAEMGALEAQRKERESLSVAEQIRQQARQRQKSLMSGQGRAGTIATSPLGIVGDATTTGQKTLLGA